MFIVGIIFICIASAGAGYCLCMWSMDDEPLEEPSEDVTFKHGPIMPYEVREADPELEALLIRQEDSWFEIEGDWDDDSMIGQLSNWLGNGWLCPTSMVGHCLYDIDDTMLDECVHCGLPFERK